MMLHSSEPSLLQHTTSKDMNVMGGTTIHTSGSKNGGTRDAATSTNVTKSKHMIQIASALPISKDTHPSLSEERTALQSHNEPGKAIVQEDPRFQTSRLFIYFSSNFVQQHILYKNENYVCHILI